MIRINWNATVDKNKKRIGVGIIAKDHDGNALASMCSTKPYIFELFFA
jgi:hypothetical protein